MDLDFDETGTLYVLKIDSNGIIFQPEWGAIDAIGRTMGRCCGSSSTTDTCAHRESDLPPIVDA
jgi:hypothetical protein